MTTGRFEIKFVFENPDVSTSILNDNSIYHEMMVVPRVGEELNDFRDNEGNNLGNFVVTNVGYSRVGNYDDGSHGITVTLKEI